jgi:hypothetical protein
LNASSDFSRSSCDLSPCSAACLQAVALERARQPRGAQLGIDEDDRLRQLALLEQLAHDARLSSSVTL